MQRLKFHTVGGDVFGPGGRLDPWAWRWETATCPDNAVPVTAEGAIAAANATGKPRRRLPVGVIGPRQATDGQRAAAREIGARFGAAGITVICGGKSGVMEAVAQGCHEAGGLCIGLLPDDDWRGANPYIAVPIATGLSEGRNMVIAKAAIALVAVGGSYGTLSEIAYGLHFGKPVFGLEGAPAIEGMHRAESIDAVVERVCERLLAQAGDDTGLL